MDEIKLIWMITHNLAIKFAVLQFHFHYNRSKLDYYSSPANMQIKFIRAGGNDARKNYITRVDDESQ